MLARLRFECRELCQSILLILVFVSFTGMLLLLLHQTLGW